MSRKKSFNLIDASLVLTILMSLLGFILARNSMAGVDKVVEGRPNVKISVLIVGLKSLDSNIFKVGDNTNLTIRNQPVEPALQIVDVKSMPRKVTFLAKDNITPIAIPDVANPYARDYLITLSQKAEMTKDGFVICGNKLKIGNQVDLEDFKYRVQGVVVDIKAIN